jgi:hypothetical protein
MAIMLSFIPFSMPRTSAAMAIRLETPSTIPNMVRNERNLWVQTSFKPISTAM